MQSLDVLTKEQLRASAVNEKTAYYLDVDRGVDPDILQDLGFTEPEQHAQVAQNALAHHIQNERREKDYPDPVQRDESLLVVLDLFGSAGVVGGLGRNPRRFDYYGGHLTRDEIARRIEEDQVTLMGRAEVAYARAFGYVTPSESYVLLDDFMTARGGKINSSSPKRPNFPETVAGAIAHDFSEFVKTYATPKFVEGKDPNRHAKKVKQAAQARAELSKRINARLEQVDAVTTQA